MSPVPEAPDQRNPNDSALAVIGRLGPAAILAGAWIVLPAIGGFILLASLGPVGTWLKDHGPLGYLIYVAVFITSAGIGILPTYSQAVLAGWAFGPLIGTALALAGFVGASILGYAIARPTARHRVEAELSRHPKWSLVRDILLRGDRLKSLGIVTLIRIPPNSPFSVTNLVLASTGVPLWIYVTGTAVGMLPRTAVIVYLASRIGAELNDDTIKEAKPFWVIIVSIALVVVIFGVLQAIVNQALERIGRGEPVVIEDDPEPTT